MTCNWSCVKWTVDKLCMPKLHCKAPGERWEVKQWRKLRFKPVRTDDLWLFSASQLQHNKINIFTLLLKRVCGTWEKSLVEVLTYFNPQFRIITDCLWCCVNQHLFYSTQIPLRKPARLTLWHIQRDCLSFASPSGSTYTPGVTTLK